MDAVNYNVIKKRSLLATCGVRYRYNILLGVYIACNRYGECTLSIKHSDYESIPTAGKAIIEYIFANYNFKLTIKSVDEYYANIVILFVAVR